MGVTIVTSNVALAAIPAEGSGEPCSGLPVFVTGMGGFLPSMLPVSLKLRFSAAVKGTLPKGAPEPRLSPGPGGVQGSFPRSENILGGKFGEH